MVGSLEERVAAMEAELDEQRELQRRVAELTDLVAELLLPIAQRDHVKVEELSAQYLNAL